MPQRQGRIYVIGDVHGDLEDFQVLLHAVHFDPENGDMLYLLGDVIDHGTGTLKILQYCMRYPRNITLVRGNHEKYFEEDALPLKTILFGQRSRKMFRKYVKTQAMFPSEERRQNLSRLADGLLASAHETGGDELEAQVKRILKLCEPPIGRAGLYQELLNITEKEYDELIEYLLRAETGVTLQVGGRHFHLTHKNPARQENKCLKSALFAEWGPFQSPTTFVFGHQSLDELEEKRKARDIPCLKINPRAPIPFAYLDQYKNAYIDLDISTRGVMMLELVEMHVWTASRGELQHVAFTDARACPERNGTWMAPTEPVYRAVYQNGFLAGFAEAILHEFEPNVIWYKCVSPAEFERRRCEGQVLAPRQVLVAKGMREEGIPRLLYSAVCHE